MPLRSQTMDKCPVHHFHTQHLRSIYLQPHCTFGIKGDLYEWPPNHAHGLRDELSRLSDLAEEDIGLGIGLEIQLSRDRVRVRERERDRDRYKVRVRNRAKFRDGIRDRVSQLITSHIRKR